MLPVAAVSWRSRSHKSVILSPAAAKYYEASEVCRERALARGIRDHVYDSGPLAPTPLYMDNHAGGAMGQMHVMQQHTEKHKHIPVRVCHLQRRCHGQMVELRPVDTSNQLCDIGTKALARQLRLDSVL